MSQVQWQRLRCSNGNTTCSSVSRFQAGQPGTNLFTTTFDRCNTARGESPVGHHPAVFMRFNYVSTKYVLDFVELLDDVLKPNRFFCEGLFDYIFLFGFWNFVPEVDALPDCHGKTVNASSSWWWWWWWWWQTCVTCWNIRCMYWHRHSVYIYRNIRSSIILYTMYLNIYIYIYIRYKKCVYMFILLPPVPIWGQPARKTNFHTPEL